MRIFHLQIKNIDTLMKDLTELLEQRKDSSEKILVNEIFKDDIRKIVMNNNFPIKDAETKEVSILLSDLRGFTAMSEKYSPLSIIELLNRYFSKMSQIIYKYGGTIDKFMGDSIMVLFGALDNINTDIKSTIACAIEMQMAMNEINAVSRYLGMSNLYMGIGINTGEVVAGTLGSEVYREYTVIGDQVNIASRVEAQSLRGQILITENTYRQSKDFIEVGTVNDVYVKGKTNSVKMYEVLAITKPERLEVPQREIRKSHRVEVNIPLDYFIIEHNVVLPENHHGTIIDISYGGLYINTNHKVESFSEIKMKLSLSLMGKGSSEVYARVLNCKKINDQYESHLEFTTIDDVAQKAIKSYVDKLI